MSDVVVVLVDLENGCHGFLDDVELHGGKLPRGLEVHVFLAKDSVLADKKLPKWVKPEWVHHAKTNEKNAADYILQKFAIQNFLPGNNSNGYRSSYGIPRVVLVSGGDRGYGGLIIDLKEKLGEKFTEFDGTGKKLTHLRVDGLHSTGDQCPCHILFDSSYARGQHLHEDSCHYCRHKYICAAEKRHEVSRCIRCPYPYFKFCDDPVQQGLWKKHLSEQHPLCDHCQHRFNTPKEYDRHKANVGHPYGCEVATCESLSPFKNRGELIKHYCQLHKEKCKKCVECDLLLFDATNCKKHCLKQHNSEWKAEPTRLQVFP